MSDLVVCNYVYEGRIQLALAAIRKDATLLFKTDSAGRTVMHWAASGGQLDFIRHCLANGASASEPDDAKWTPLMIAVSAGRVKVASFFIKDGTTNVSASNSGGQTALHYAASKNHLILVEALLEAGALPGARDLLGSTPLHRAAALDHVDVARTLLGDGGRFAAVSGAPTNPDDSVVSPNVQDSVGQTPVHNACEAGNMTMLNWLHTYGGRLDVKDKDGNTPLDVAPSALRVKIERLFQTM